MYNTGCIKLLGDGHSFLGGDSQFSGGKFLHLHRFHRKWAPFRLRLIVDVRYTRGRTGQALLNEETRRTIERGRGVLRVLLVEGSEVSETKNQHQPRE